MSLETRAEQIEHEFLTQNIDTPIFGGGSLNASFNSSFNASTTNVPTKPTLSKTAGDVKWGSDSRAKLDEEHTKAINYVSWQSAGLRALQTLNGTDASQPMEANIPFSTEKKKSSEEAITVFPSLYMITVEKIQESLRQGIYSTTLNPKLIRLKDEIFLQLPPPIPRCFKDFYNSKDFDIFLKNGVCYIQLYLLLQKAQLAASSKAGIDQLKRVFLSQLALMHTKETEDTTPDSMDSLKRDEKEVFKHFCKCYSQVLQSFGGSMNFAVERSFYERFYLAIGFFFKAHIPPEDWPCVCSHLSYVLHTNLQAHMHAASFHKRKKSSKRHASLTNSKSSSESNTANNLTTIDLFNESFNRARSKYNPFEKRKSSFTKVPSRKSKMFDKIETLKSTPNPADPKLNNEKDKKGIRSTQDSSKPQEAPTEPSVESKDLNSSSEPTTTSNPIQNESDLSTSDKEENVFSLNSVIYARSPLIACMKPTSRDRSIQLFRKSKQIIQRNSKRRIEKSRQSNTQVAFGASSEIGPTLSTTDIISADTTLLPTKLHLKSNTTQPFLPKPTQSLSSFAYTRPRLSQLPLYKLRSVFSYPRRPVLLSGTYNEDKDFKSNSFRSRNAPLLSSFTKSMFNPLEQKRKDVK